MTLTEKNALMMLEEQRRKYFETLQEEADKDILERYKKYKQQIGGSFIKPIVEDVSDKKTPSSLQQANTANNIDMLGTTDFLTQIGVSTGNSTLTKAGLLGSTVVNAIQQFKGLKGLKGTNRVNGISGVVGGFSDSADQILFGDQWAKNSNLTNGMNSVYDMTSFGLMSMGGIPAAIGGGMKLGGLLSDGLSAMGIKTDQKSTTDKILDSKFLKLTPIGLANAIGAKSSDKFTVDNNVRSQIGGAYGGAYAFMDDAASKANKKYGLFSGGSRHEANRKIAESKLIQNTIGNINKDARDMQSIADNSSDLLSTNYQYKLSGALDQRYIRAAKFGDKIQRIKKINFSKRGGQIHQKINLETKEVEWEPIIIHRVEELKQGGTIDQTYDNQEPTIINDEWEPIIIESTNQLKNGGELKHTPQKKEEINKKSRSLLELIEYSKKVNPRFIQRLSEPLKYVEWVDDNGEKQFGTHELGYAEVNGKYVIFPNIQERDDKQLFRYTDFRQALDNALKNKNVLWVDSEDEAKLFTESKELENGKFSGYKSGWPDYFKQKPKFYNGGKTEESKEKPLSNQQNVIPEGALHARLHHMDNDKEITKKGIPVIDDKGEQQAEIELNEIIFNLEVTKKLEELCKDGSDEAAIEAGKLLVQEILFNTEDRTNLINTLKQGGIINGNTE